MNIKTMIEDIKKNNDYNIDDDVELIIAWVKDTLEENKRISKPGLAPYYDEKIKDFSDIENVLKELNEEEMSIVKDNIEETLKGVCSTIIDLYGEDFNARFNKKDYANMISTYLLMIKCNKEQTFMISKDNFYTVLNSAFRGNRFIEFKQLLTVITNPKFLKIMNMDGFVDGNGSVLRALSNDLDTRKEPFNFDDADNEVNTFLQGKINMLKMITKDTSKEETLRIKLSQNKQYDLETISRAKQVNQYNIFEDKIAALDLYDTVAIDKIDRFLEFVEYLKTKGNRWDITKYTFDTLFIMQNIDISLYNNESLFMIIKTGQFKDIVDPTEKGR